MNFRWDKKYLYWGITSFLVIFLSIIGYLIISKFNIIIYGINFIVELLMPFIYGIIIAFLVNPIMNLFEKKAIIPILKKNKRYRPSKLSRGLAITLAFIVVSLILWGLVSMIFPQIKESIVGITEKLTVSGAQLDSWFNGFIESNPWLAELLPGMDFSDGIVTHISSWVSDSILPTIENFVISITKSIIITAKSVINIFVGIILSVYILIDKEHFFSQSKKIIYALFPINAANLIIRNTRMADRIFGKFIIGKILDSIIIGIISFICLSLLKMPFPLLISIIIGVTNVIPFFGPFIGAIPSALLILIIDPLQSFYFLLFILALQQFDGNILGPKILGDATGLSGLWVIFSILFFGGIWGFPGMLIGVPTFAILYFIMKEFIENKLKNKLLPIKTIEYDNLDKIDDSKQALYLKNSSNNNK